MWSATVPSGIGPAPARTKTMKKILSATLGSLMLLTAATGAASARPWHGGGYRHDNTGAYVAAGIGLFALGAILASSHHHDRYDDGYYGYRDVPPPPPPPPRAYDRYGYDRDYDRYDDRY